MVWTQKYLQRRMEVIINDSNDAITVQDLDGKILTWNKGAEKMYGYSSDEAIGMSISKLIPNDLSEDLPEYLQLIRKGEIVESYETQRLTKDGKVLDVWLVITCLKDDEGIIDSIAITERDITNIKNLLREKDKELKTLKGFLPICASCKEIRDDQGYWHQIESYISEHSEAEFSHGICPKCLDKLYPGYKDKIK